VNRSHILGEEDQPQSKTFAAGIEFIRRNHREDRWCLQIETFDPHEPFFAQHKYKDLYRQHYERYKGRHFDWPPYRRVRETREEVEHCRHEYAALLSMCDANLGPVLDVMDELDLWEDTLLVVWTDHGFLLGEHDCWAKVWLPWYQELANTPFFVANANPHAPAFRGGGFEESATRPTVFLYQGLSHHADSGTRLVERRQHVPHVPLGRRRRPETTATAERQEGGNQDDRDAHSLDARMRCSRGTI
jgi:arylsulfatase A-like enzyme